MPTPFRLPVLLSLALATGLALGSCKKDSATPAPTVLTPSQQLTTGSWQLDQVKQGGQVSTGNAIKDRYSLTFRPDGTLTRRLLADNTTYPGAWMLTSGNTLLRLTDNKGVGTDYTLAALTATELRYAFTNNANQLEERQFSSQP